MLQKENRSVTIKKTKLKITPRSGLILIEELAKELGIDKLIQNSFEHLKKSNKVLSVSRQILDICSLLIDGGACIDDLKQLRNDDGWKTLRNEPLSMSTRTAIDLLHKFKEVDIAKFEKLSSKIIKQNSNKITQSDIITIDVDATFIPSEKKHAKIGHHGIPGYYPMLGFWVEKGVSIQGEFRNGNESPGSKHLPSSKYLANAVYFHINLLAYNLVQLLKIIKLDPDYFYSTIKTLRYHFFHVAGIITKHARKTFLNIYHKYQHFNFFESTLAHST
jgi:hypothetical protein